MYPGTPGASWGALGTSWGALGATLKNHQEIDTENDRFWLPKGCQKGAKIAPKRDPKRTKIEDKIRHEKTTLKIHLGAILG